MYKMSGIGRYLQNLLPALIPRLNASRIYVLGKSGDVADEGWFHDPRIYFRESPARIFSAAEQWAVATGLYRDIDLLWVPQYNFPLLYRGKLVVTIHDLCQLAHPEMLANDLQRGYAKYLLSRVAKRASAVLCVSEFTASEMEKYLMIDRKRVVVAYPAIGEPWDFLTPSLIKPSSSRYLLAVGNLKRNKNLPRLVTAFNEIRHLIPHDLVLVGRHEGFLNSETELQNIPPDIENRIRFTGHVTDLELHEYYRNAEALVFPSFYEGFGYPIVEAMAEGCPIACSNVSSLPEVAGDAALLFDPFSVRDIAQALVHIATDAKMRADLTERGKRRFLHFADTTSADLTSATINRILDE